MMNHGGDWAGYLAEHGKTPLDFSANISPIGMPAAALQAAVKSLAEADRYPDPYCRVLRRKLADVHGIREETIVCGNGAADLIWRICCCLHPKKALIPIPTFTEYEAALTAVGCECLHFSLKGEADFQLDAESFARSIADGTELVFLCNPNNPTGQLLERNEVRQILLACRERRATLILDECFLDFIEQPEKYTLTGELEKYSNLVILKAFTKTYAMAGLRLGYALCGDKRMAERLFFQGQPWPVSHPAQAAGIAALGDADYPRRLRALITRERARLREEFAALGMRVIPGRANFLLLWTADEALGGKLLEKGILLRDCADFPGLGTGWFRAAVRTQEENEQLLAAVREVLEHG